MADPVESEIKMAASPAMLEALRTHRLLAGAEQTTTLVTTYFDTPGGGLRQGGASLRIRHGAKAREQTLKLNAPGGSSVRRSEWNVAAAGDLPEPLAFPDKPRTELVRLLNGGAFEPVATTNIERTTRRLHFGGSDIEIAFDRGTIRAGDREEAVCEFEMELVDGQFSDILALALELPLGRELSWSVSSKAERCYALAFDLQPAAGLAQPVNLLPSMNAAQGFQAIVWNCLEQLLINYPLVIASGNAESVHQSRVAMRRLRAAWSLFGNVVEDDAAAALRAQLKAVANGLGPARDLHVLLGRTRSAAASGDDDVCELQAHLGARRDAAVQSAQALLAASPFQCLLFDLAGWIENGKWLARIGETGGSRPLTPFAAKMLSRRRRKLRRLGDCLADMPDPARHRLRIDVKKLRYAADFFESLYRGKATAKHHRAFSKGLGRLQDSLGELNDMFVATQSQSALFEDLEPITAAKLAQQLDGLLHDHVQSRRKLLKTSQRWLTRTIDAPAWWKPVKP